jgi:hypothetical protein
MSRSSTMPSSVKRAIADAFLRKHRSIRPAQNIIVTLCQQIPSHRNRPTILCTSSKTLLASPSMRAMCLISCRNEERRSTSAGTNQGGLYFEQGWDNGKIRVLYTLYLVESVMFAIAWAVLGHDVQTAFTVVAYWVAAGASLLIFTAMPNSS